MDDSIRHAAISQMCKTAAATRLYAKVMQKVAERRPRPSEAYIAGFCKAAEDAGVNPEELMKMAGFWGAVTTPLRLTGNVLGGAYGAIKNTITGEDGGDGFWSRLSEGAKSGWTTADNVQREIPGAIFSMQSLKNLGHGVASFGTGLTRGLLSIPGAITGAVGALGYGLTGNGFGKGWDAGKGLVENHIGAGKYDIGWLKRRLGSLQQANTDAYMENNNMDPNNMSTLDRMGMFGMSLANAAGEGIGDAIAWNGISGMAGKGFNLARKGLSSGWNALEAARGGTGTLANISSGMHRVMDPVARGAKSVASRFHLPGGAGSAAAETASTAGNAASGAAGAAGGAAGGASSSFGAFRPGNLLNAYMAKADAWDPAWENTNNFIASTGDFIRTPSVQKFPWDNGSAGAQQQISG